MIRKTWIIVAFLALVLTLSGSANPAAIRGDMAFGAVVAKPQCMDHFDNDGDGKIDYPADPGCTSKNDSDETDVVQPPPPPPPSTTVTSSITNGSTIGGNVSWRVDTSVTTANITVLYFIDGVQVFSDCCQTPFYAFGEPNGTLNTATYPDGVHILREDATGGATGSATQTVTFNNSSPPPASPWFANSFEGDLAADISAAPYILSYANGGGRPFSSTYFKAITGQSGQGLGLQVDSAEPFDSGDLGPLTAMTVGSTAAHTAKDESTWYRVKFKLPSTAFVNGSGGYHWLVEWHENMTSGGCVSTALGLINYHGALNTNQFYFRPAGGDCASPRYEDFFTKYPSGTVIPDHWYDLVWNVVWDTVASDSGGKGQISFWIDGQPAVMCKTTISSDCSNTSDVPWSNPHPFPTLFHDSAGTVDNPEFGLYNYRRALSAGQSSRVDFDELAWGPSAASVGFTP